MNDKKSSLLTLKQKNPKVFFLLKLLANVDSCH